MQAWLTVLALLVCILTRTSHLSLRASLRLVREAPWSPSLGVIILDQGTELMEEQPPQTE